MNGILNPVVFYPAAILMIVFVFLSICFKNIFYSLISAILVFFIAGYFFYILGSEYNAVIQIAIYGISVPIVLGLAIMFTDSKYIDQQKPTFQTKKYSMILVSGIFILAFIYLIKTSLLINPNCFNFNLQNTNTSIQVLNTFAYGLFVKYIWAFELIAIILTIIVIGISILIKKEQTCKK